LNLEMFGLSQLIFVGNVVMVCLQF
jgi:hypothetical protein